jgi:hypothetical protein
MMNERTEEKPVRKTVCTNLFKSAANLIIAAGLFIFLG